MTFKQRLPYYLIGFFFGIVIVYFILDKKETEFNYGPNARVLKNIRVKNYVYSDQLTKELEIGTIDTIKIAQILKDGDVDIWNKIKEDSCITYNIQGSKKLKYITLTIKNCDSIAFFEKVVFQ